MGGGVFNCHNGEVGYCSADPPIKYKYGCYCECDLGYAGEYCTEAAYRCDHDSGKCVKDSNGNGKCKQPCWKWATLNDWAQNYSAQHSKGENVNKLMGTNGYHNPSFPNSADADKCFSECKKSSLQGYCGYQQNGCFIQKSRQNNYYDLDFWTYTREK